MPEGKENLNMNETETAIEQQLLDRPLPDYLPADENWVLPHYGGLSIANLPATIAALLGSDLPGALPPLPRELWADWLPGLRRVVLVLVDALGLRLLQGAWAAGDGQPFSYLAGAGRLIPLTSVVPSTTDAALLSLRSGRPPAEHGWLAYEMYLRELGIATNAIVLRPVWGGGSDVLLDWGLDLKKIVTVPTLPQRLAEVGIESHGVLANYLRKSGFSQMLYRGTAEIRGHAQASDLWVQLRHVLAETRGQPAFISAYCGSLDNVAHIYGPDSDSWRAEFRSIGRLLEHEFLAQVPAEDRESTLLLLTADHGQIRVPKEHIVTADKDPELSRHLQVPIMGESRAAFVHPRPGRAGAIRSYLEETFPGWFAVVDSAQALDAGLMGLPVTDEAYARAGELLVLGRGDCALQRSEPGGPMLGRHGGLSPEEMLVPLIGTRLEALT
jgi:predicted AlkP superfamily pyrophosphatase or phosphodiesterase